jgi:NAD-dependent deacetylase
VIHLHGRLLDLRCFACQQPHHGFRIPDDAARSPRQRIAPPRCRHCGGEVRPGVVWFGEPLPEQAWLAAEAAVRAAELAIVIGTSGVVQPASHLVGMARQNGARVVEINPAASAHSAAADLVIRNGAATALPALVQRLRAMD